MFPDAAIIREDKSIAMMMMKPNPAAWEEKKILVHGLLGKILKGEICYIQTPFKLLLIIGYHPASSGNDVKTDVHAAQALAFMYTLYIA